MMNWKKLRDAVWERDKGICQVCLEVIPYIYYECGHKIDRCAGGQDIMENLVVMCNSCNRLKPVHSTIEEYEEWLRQPHPLEQIIKKTLAGLSPQETETLKRAFGVGNDL